MEINVDGEDVDLEKRLHGLCRDLLSNPVIEDYELQTPNGAKTKTERKRTAAK
jgi:phosphoribosylformylglycinamidine (FGAM) synthase PurS component